MTVYLDHAATTPLHPRARGRGSRHPRLVGNASSVHRAGQAARRLLEESRERVAAALECDPIEVVFTSGGTESINLALKGLWWARAGDRDRRAPRWRAPRHDASVAWLGAAHAGRGCGPAASTPSARSRCPRSRRRSRCAAGHGARRQQRGRHGPGRRRARRGGRGGGRAAAPRRRRRGRLDRRVVRALAGRRRGTGRARGAVRLGAQGRRTGRHRGARRVAPRRARPARARRRTAARPALGHPDLPGRRRASPRSRPRSRIATRTRPCALGALRDRLRDGIAAACPMPSCSATRCDACRATCTRCSRVRAGRRCCSSSTPPGSPSRPAPRARPACRGAAGDGRALGATTAPRARCCGSRSGCTSTDADVDAVLAALPDALPARGRGRCGRQTPVTGRSSRS